jgi:hypothetical protein
MPHGSLDLHIQQTYVSIAQNYLGINSHILAEHNFIIL